MSRHTSDNVWLEIGCISVLLMGLFMSVAGSWIVRSYFEARTYTKLTGKEVSTWDAMWVELRVENK